MRRIAATTLALLVTGCAMRPGYGVDRIFAARWGCAESQVLEMADELSAELPTGQYYIPQVGWDACELMAALGRPRDVDTMQSRFGESANWWYGSGPNLTLVSLENDGGRWVVDYVGN